MDCSLIRPPVAVVQQSDPPLKVSPSPRHSTVHVHRSPNRRFVFRTVVTEHEHTQQVIVRQTLVWYDTKQKRYRKRTELQMFDVDDEDHESIEFNRFVAQQLWK